MNEPYEHEVYFFEYCHKCKYKDLPSEEEPCNECLDNGSTFASHKPLKYEPADKK